MNNDHLKESAEFYINSIREASGIMLNQAKTCFYYAVSTYLLFHHRITRIPILLFTGAHGTGKSSLLEVMNGLVYEPKMISAESNATFRDEIAQSTTAIIDEGDKVNEDYLIKRYDLKTSLVSHNISKSGGWQAEKISIYGATIIVRRTPFQDPAATSRSIIIRTKYTRGEYKFEPFKHANSTLKEIASQVKLEKTSQRTNNNWAPLQAVARYLEDNKWLEYSEDEIVKNTQSLRAGQNYEPEQLILMVLREKMIKRVNGEDIIISNSVAVSDIRNELKSVFDTHLKNYQIEEICRALGFSIVSHSGYPKVKGDQKLLIQLLKEREL